jgi:hypothetical protein
MLCPEVIDITVCISPCSGTVQEALLQLPQAAPSSRRWTP